MEVLAIDIGGSAIKSAKVTIADGKVEGFERAQTVEITERHFDQVCLGVEAIVSNFLSNAASIDCVGISTTGSVSADGVVLNAGHFENYSNINWNSILGNTFPKLGPVHVVNDGRAATIAEYSVRPRQGPSTFIHVVVGTGVGCGLFVDGHFHQGDGGAAGNLGHLKLTSKPTRVCSCGSQGCLEVLAAGPSVVSIFESMSPQHREPCTEAILAFPDIVSLAKGGDANAILSLRIAGEWLGRGISYAINLLNPSDLSIGGGLIEAGVEIEKVCGLDPYFEAAERTARALAHHRPGSIVNIYRGHFGNDGGMIGVALHAALKSS